jgi:hypothetical protein
MPGPVAALELTVDELHQLAGWVRAGTTPQRLARRARLILGSAATHTGDGKIRSWTHTVAPEINGLRSPAK